MKLTVTAGPHEYKNCPMSARVETDGLQPGEASLIDSTGARKPCQIFDDRGQIAVAWIESELSSGETKVYDLDTAVAARATRVDISDAGENRLDIRIGGKLFTCYNYSAEYPRPFFYPFLSHDGAQVTRDFPMREVPGDDTDHKHHRSVWVAYGEVNGTDNWSEKDDCARIMHQAFEQVTSGPVLGRIRSVNLWTSRDGAPQMTDVREFTFYNVDGERLMDARISFRATEGDVLLGDTKEGGIISVRVAATMDGTKAGMIVNSYGGKTEAETWGRPAQWVDYFGPVGSKTYGIAIMDHPSSFRYPTRWHVRDYGLFTANPFALKAYEPDRDWTGDHTIKKGEQIDFRYRLCIHAGDTWAAQVGERYFCFAEPPKVEVT